MRRMRDERKVKDLLTRWLTEKRAEVKKKVGFDEAALARARISDPVQKRRALGYASMIEETKNEIRVPVRSAKNYARLRTKNLTKGVNAIIGFKTGGGSEIQSLRFDKKKFTRQEAKAWAKKQNFQEYAMKQVKDFVLFRAGEYPQGTITVDDLDQVVKNYDPDKLHEAPVAIGHVSDYKDSRAPAFGWIGGLKRVGEDLIATGAELAEEAIQWTKDGFYKKVSAAFYKPDDETNPTPGEYYLHHVALLGAQPPAVKGMPALGFVEYAEKSNPLVMEFFDASPEEIAIVANEAEEDTLAQLQEETDDFIETVKQTLADEQMTDGEKYDKISEARFGLSNCVDRVLGEHVQFMTKKDHMLERVKQHLAEMMEKWGIKVPWDKKVVETNSSQSQAQRKESEMDEKEKQAFQEKIASLEQKTVDIQAKLAASEAEKVKIAADLKLNTDAIAADRAQLVGEKLAGRVAQFVDRKVAEGYSRRKLEELKVAEMLTALAKSSDKVKFAEGDKSIESVFEEFFSKVPKATFDEVVPDKDRKPEQKVPDSVLRSPYPVDGRGLKIVNFAEKYRKDNPELFKGMTPDQARSQICQGVLNKSIQFIEQ